MSTTAKFKIGEHVASWNSGLAYIVIATHDLDDCGSVAYSVRRLRGGEVWGPTKIIAESRLCATVTVEIS